MHGTKVMSCAAPPGWYCPPLSTRPTICPENWYCLGGAEMARRCPDGRWSAIQSMYPEDCTSHMTVNLAAVILLLFALISLGLCIWLASWEWEERDRKFRQEGCPQQYTHYGSVCVRGRPYDVYQVHGAGLQNP